MKEDCAHRTDTKRTGSVMYAPPANVPVSVACDAASCCLHVIIVCSHGMCRLGTERICSRTDVGRCTSSAGEACGCSCKLFSGQPDSCNTLVMSASACLRRFHRCVGPSVS